MKILNCRDSAVVCIKANLVRVMHCLQTFTFIALTLASPRFCPADQSNDFSGRWRPLYVIKDGTTHKRFPGDEGVNPSFVYFRDKEYFVIIGEQVSPFSYTIDVQHTPIHFDCTYIGDDLEMTKKYLAPMKGIIKLEGDRMFRCLGAPGADRPNSFESKQGDGRTLSVLERIGSRLKLE